MRTYKKIITITFSATLLALLLPLGACSDLLDQKPQGEWTNVEAGTFETDVFSLYAKIRGYNITSGNGPLAIHNFRSEDVEKGSTDGDGSAFAKMYDDFEYNASNGSLDSYWTDNYSMIHLANKVLDDIKDFEAEGNELGDGEYTSRAEASFFRAFAYFNLVRAFGEVPIYTKRLNDANDANNPKSKIEEIYKLIDEDLTAAAEKLPPKWEVKYIGRLTVGAAKSLHARTHMMRSNWKEMYDLSKEVILTGVYDLNTPFNKVFREDGENCSESVFELQCTATASQPADNKIGSQYAAIQGVRGSGDWNLGWGWHTPTELLAQAFEPNDPRKDETLLYFGRQGDPLEDLPSNKPWGEKPIAFKDVTAKYFNKKAYTNPEMRKTYSKGGYWVNIRIIRYSDVLLMAAEAANELGNTADAIDYLEQVRFRARGGDNTILPKVTTTDQEELRQAIRHERRIELAMEWDRFYDLVRWGVARDVLHAAGKTKYADKHKYYPLPQNQIDKSNGVLIQNPNY